MKSHGAARSLPRNSLSCRDCGAGLPPPDAHNRSSCFYCGATHRAEAQSEVIAVAPPAPGTFVRDRESSHAGEEAARIPMTEDAVLRLLRERFADDDPIFVCPHIPARKEQIVRQAHLVHLPENERILALHDASWLGHGAEGFIVTARRLCWKNAGEPACSMTWRDLDPELLGVERRELYVSSVAAIKIDDDAVLEACAEAFHVLALSALPVRGATSAVVPIHQPTTTSEAVLAAAAVPTLSFPPAALRGEPAPDRACWHCHTPVLATAPQCHYCGALPKRRGWIRPGR